VAGGYRRLHNRELHKLYASSIIIEMMKSRRIRRERNAARIGEMRNAHNPLVGKPEGKRQLGRLRRTWEDNIRMDLRETGCECMDCVHLAQDRD
jgi:hypothetical protein